MMVEVEVEGSEAVAEVGSVAVAVAGSVAVGSVVMDWVAAAVAGSAMEVVVRAELVVEVVVDIGQKPQRGWSGGWWSRPRAGHSRSHPSTLPYRPPAGHTSGSHPERCSSPS